MAAAGKLVPSRSDDSKSHRSSEYSPLLRQALERQTRHACESQEDEAMDYTPPAAGDMEQDGNGMSSTYANQPPQQSHSPRLDATCRSPSSPHEPTSASPIPSFTPSFLSISTSSSTSSSPSFSPSFSSLEACLDHLSSIAFPQSLSPSSSSSSSPSIPSSSSTSSGRNRRHRVSRMAFLASRQLPRPKGPHWHRRPGLGLRNYATVQPSDPWRYAYSSKSKKTDVNGGGEKEEDGEVKGSDTEV